MDGVFQSLDFCLETWKGNGEQQEDFPNLETQKDMFDRRT
jgi:hypothetical protein